jgi:hypothetical protein
VERAADQIDSFSRSLREKDVNELLDDAQQLARRQPALFIGGAFVLGLIGARFFKSSAQSNGSAGRYGNGRSGQNLMAGQRTGAPYASQATTSPYGTGIAESIGNASDADLDGDPGVTPGGSRISPTRRRTGSVNERG